MQSNSDNTQFRRNLCTLVQWEGSYMDRQEPLNVRYNGAFSALDATNLVFEGNHVGGTERVGFSLPPESCVTTPANPYKDNVAHTTLLGLAITPKDAEKLTWTGMSPLPFLSPPSPPPHPSPAYIYMDNVAHATLLGLAITPKDAEKLTWTGMLPPPLPLPPLTQAPLTHTRTMWHTLHY